jgi:transcriptional regulator with XRE-family HTH domain
MKLKQWRTEKGYSQSKLAEMVSQEAGDHVAQSTLHSWENGRMPPTDKALAIQRITRGKVQPESFLAAKA